MVISRNCFVGLGPLSPVSQRTSCGLDLYRSSFLAWHADFTEQSCRHLRDIYPDLYDAVIARGRHQPIPLLQRAQAAAQGAAGQAPAPAQQQQPRNPSSPTGPADQAAAPSAAAPNRASTESPSRRPSSTHQHQGRVGGGTKL